MIGNSHEHSNALSPITPAPDPGIKPQGILDKIASRVPGVVFQYRLNPDGSSCFPYASDAITEIYRLSAEAVQLDASPVFKILHPDDYETVVASIQQSALELSPWLHEYRVKFEDGTVRWLLGNSLPERESDGATLWHGFITDITERKELEKKTRLVKNSLMATFDAIPDLLFEMNLEGQYLAVHSPRSDLLLNPAHYLLGKFVMDVLPAEAGQVALAALQEADENGYSIGKTYSLDLPQGKTWFELSISRKSTEPGEERRLVVLSRDITARKLAEDKLRHLSLDQHRLNRSLQMISQCHSVIAQAKDEKKMIEALCQLIGQMSPFLLTWIGLTQSDKDPSIVPQAQFGKDQLYLKSIQVSWEAEQAVGFSSTVKAIQTASTQIVDVEWGDHFNVLWLDASRHNGARCVASLPLLHEQQFLGVLVIHSAAENKFSMTEIELLESLALNIAFGIKTLRVRRELDRHQLQLEELVIERTQEIEVLNQDLKQKKDESDAANIAKRDFISNLSHELRTPLNAVVGLTGLLAQSPLNSRQSDYAEKIQLSAKALRALIDDILDFSKIEAHELQLEHAPFSLNTILISVAAVLGVGIGHKAIEPLLAVDADVADGLVGDALRLQQILLNLISNTHKFTHAGEIALTVRCLSGSDAHEGSQTLLQFSVRDTGIGMDRETLKLIFTEFTQADASISRLYGGTGLGLAISARLAILMGGRIEVESVLGQGSEFRLELPFTLGRRKPKASQQQPLPANLRVLIVDDHSLSRVLLTKSCLQLGWQAKALESGALGLDELLLSSQQNKQYDLMLLDWRMPGMDGLEMLRRAYATAGTGLPLVLLMAPLVEIEEAVASSAEFNLDGIIAKPLSTLSFFDVVAKVFAGEMGHTKTLPVNHGGRLKGLQLLVAEDNALNREVIEQMLTRAGAHVVLADHGQAALDVLSVPDANFDAVLMDIQMPVMDGYAATRLIREQLGLLNLPIIAVTAHARPQDRERSSQAGMVGHLVKPLNLDEMLEVIVRATRSKTSALTDSVAPKAISETQLPGLDLPAALKLFGGDADKLGSILQRFVAQQGDDVKAARRFYLEGDAEGAFQRVHGLRGVAAFLHATELHRLSGIVEAGLNKQPPEVTQELFDALEAAMESLRSSQRQFEAWQANAEPSP